MINNRVTVFGIELDLSNDQIELLKRAGIAKPCEHCEEYHVKSPMDMAYTILLIIGPKVDTPERAYKSLKKVIDRAASEHGITPEELKFATGDARHEATDLSDLDDMFK
jgi:hypothetical protein